MKDLSFLKKLVKIPKFNKNIVNGFDMGIPLNIIQTTFTSIHYGENIITPNLILLQFLIGFYTYSKDRYYDALEWNSNKYDTNKNDLFEFLIKYQEEYKILYNLSFIFISIIMINEVHDIIQIIPIISLLLLTNYYKEIKKISPFIKPFYISIMWTLCCIVLPCLLHDKNYNIINYPLDYLPITLTMFANSNALDIRDIKEDRFNQVQTIPVKYGLLNSQSLSLIFVSLSCLIFGLNKHYLNEPFMNSLWEIQNLGISYYVFSFNNTNF